MDVDAADDVGDVEGGGRKADVAVQKTGGELKLAAYTRLKVRLPE
jgi:hypothetical protein